jgi:hypothetical protein
MASEPLTSSGDVIDVPFFKIPFAIIIAVAVVLITVLWATLLYIIKIIPMCIYGYYLLWRTYANVL